MKILHIANEVVSTGNGIVNSAVDLACTQSEAGHNVSFVSSGGGYVDLLETHRVKHYNAHMYAKKPVKFLKGLPKLRRIIREERPDIVHAHMMTTAILMRIGRDVAGFGDYKLVTTVHNEWRMTSTLMQAGDRVIMLSENGRRRFLRRGFPADKMRVVRHGVLQSPRRREEISAASPPRENDPEIRIVTLAGLYKRKGIGDLILAFGQIADEFPRVSLQILGWGPDREYLENLKSVTRGSERIHFKGFEPKPHRVLREASIFVLASHTEAFSLAIAEAREAGCAIIATTVGGIPELLDHGRAGILIPPHQPMILAEELRRLLKNPEELQRAREAARSDLDWLSCARMSSETLDVYRSLLSPQPQRSAETLCRRHTS